MPGFKPDGYNSVSPYLIVSGAAGTIDFLEAAFGAKRLRQHTDEGGRLMHGEVMLDDTVVMLADATPEWPALPAHVHVYVADVDASYAAAIAAGGASAQEPVQKGDEDKRGGVTDAGGTTWWIATRVG